MSSGNVTRRDTLRGASAALFLGANTARATPLDCDVLVLGAGMSGLHAARMLDQAGLSVLVIEGSSRIGGRCWTARDVPGRPELGAQQIGFGYGRVRSNAADLGIELVLPPSGSYAETRLPPVAVSIGGQLPDTVPWPASPMNHLPPEEKQMSPLQLFSHYLLKNNPLVGLEDWQKPEFAGIDRMSLRQYLARNGASPEALRLMNVSVAARDLDDANALDFLRKQYYYVWEAGKGAYSVVKDGTDALTTAMAKSLKHPVVLNKVVAQIDTGPEQVSVHCNDGTRYRARACINTIPLSVMKNIPVSGNVPPAQRSAWAEQRYNQLIQVFFKINSPFWEKDGMAPTMWTDSPIELILHTPSMVEPSGILYAYINGRGVEPLNKLTPRVLGEKVLAELTRLRPASKGQIEVSHIHNWSTYPYSKGHVAYFAPGDVARYANIGGQPAGAMYFAGEHNCRVHAGIEGACEAAENSAIQVLTALGKA